MAENNVEVNTTVVEEIETTVTVPGPGDPAFGLDESIVDLTDVFDRIFQHKAFSSFAEFEELFTQFREETGSVFRIKSSCSIDHENTKRKKHHIPERFKYISITYCCVHFGQPKISGRGIRSKQRYLPCGCYCLLALAYSKGALIITQAHMRHNHHVSSQTAPYYAINRRVSKHELQMVEEEIRVTSDNKALQQYLQKRFNRPMTIQDVKNLKSRIKMKEAKSAAKEAIASIELSSKERGELVDEEYKVEASQRPKWKNKTMDEVIRKLTALLDNSDGNVFWERITSINKILECWEKNDDVSVSFKGGTVVVKKVVKQTPKREYSAIITGKRRRGRPRKNPEYSICTTIAEVGEGMDKLVTLEFPNKFTVSKDDQCDSSDRVELPLLDEPSVQLLSSTLKESQVELDVCEIKDSPEKLVKKRVGRPKGSVSTVKRLCNASSLLRIEKEMDKSYSPSCDISIKSEMEESFSTSTSLPIATKKVVVMPAPFSKSFSIEPQDPLSKNSAPQSTFVRTVTHAEFSDVAPQAEVEIEVTGEEVLVKRIKEEFVDD